MYMIMDIAAKNHIIDIFFSAKELMYPASKRLAGAAKIIKVGEAGSGISFTFNVLYSTIGSRTMYDTNQKIICPAVFILNAGAVTLATTIPT